MIDARAIVSAEAELAANVSIGPFSIVGARVRIGPRTVVGPHVVINGPTTIGADNRFFQFASIGDAPQDKKYQGEPTRLQIGDRNVFRESCTVNRGTTHDKGVTLVGSDNLFMAYAHVAHDCVVGNNTVFANCAALGGHVEIGANTTVDRGASDDTVIEEGVKLDNLIQIGHNVHIGAHSALAACIGVAGSTTIGKRCMIGGGAGFAGHLTIADDVVITGYSAVTHSIARAGVYSGTLPVEEAHAWRRLVARFKRSGLLEKRVRAVERVAGLKSDQEEDHD